MLTKKEKKEYNILDDIQHYNSTWLGVKDTKRLDVLRRKKYVK